VSSEIVSSLVRAADTQFQKLKYWEIMVWYINTQLKQKKRASN